MYRPTNCELSALKQGRRCSGFPFFGQTEVKIKCLRFTAM